MIAEIMSFIGLWLCIIALNIKTWILEKKINELKKQIKH